MNKKLIVLLMTAVTVLNISAHFCRDGNGNHISCTKRITGGSTDVGANVTIVSGRYRRKDRQQKAQKAQYKEQVVEESISEDSTDAIEPQFVRPVVNGQ